MLHVIGFEFAIVSVLPLLTELHPEARASGMGLAVGCGTVGRALAAVVSTRLYTAHGVGASGVAGAVCATAVLALMAMGVRETAG
jgi:predicted MFS family arabinose efflux permease